MPDQQDQMEGAFPSASSSRANPGPARDNASFLNNAREDSAKTKSNLLEMPSISLPKGGGALKNIDEKFSVNAVNGTAGYSIPLPFSPGRKSGTPSMALSYNSGIGNSAFGLGWSLDLPCIQRKTEKELPLYQDASESDTFIFSGAEDLVPSATKNPDKSITNYRPRIEGGFARIEKLNDNGNIYWRVRTKDNIVSVFGRQDTAKIFSPVPADSDKIFRWCLEYSYDDKGNYIQYIYKKENKDNIIPSAAEKNRLNDLAPFTNSYLKNIRYGNVTAWYEGDDPPIDFLFEVVFDYGEHDPVKPTTQEIAKWSVRQDPFSDYRSGFEIRTCRLCRRVLQFHHFRQELGWDDYLARSLDFTYDEHPHLTYLDQLVQTGYIWNTDGSLRSKRSLPPLEFDYFKPDFIQGIPNASEQEIKFISAQNIANAPTGIYDPSYQWTDLYSEGIAGILSEQATGWFYKENLGNGAFAPAKIVSPRPSFAGLGNGDLVIQDLEADGKKYLVKTTGSVKGFYPLDTDDEWQGFHAFEKFPNIDQRDPNLRFLDLNGDGMPDMLLSHQLEFIWYAAKGRAGYDDYQLTPKAADEERGPQIVFADKDAKSLIATADMSGDGLLDIVLINYSNVSYYPNLGYGRWGARVTLPMNGCFAAYADFNPQFLHLADIDGSGTTDLIYIGNNKIQVWYNQSGNSLADPSEYFNPFPSLDGQAKISFIDLLGNGVSCLVWSSSFPGEAYAPLRYIDMMGGQKPHIMFSHKNNMGREITLEYRSSTQFYLDDKQKGQNWATRLPFPVQCVSKMTTVDKVAQTRFTNEYSYHHGYYDAKEREFRGFARVDQRDTEEYDQFVLGTQTAGASNATEQDLYQPVVITRTWYHTGAWPGRENIVHQLQGEYFPDALIASGQLTDPAVIAAIPDLVLDEQSVLPAGLTACEIPECYRALKGLALRREVYSEEGDPQTQLYPYTVEQHDYDIQLLQPKGQEKYGVFLAHEKETLVVNYERDPLDPRIGHTINVQIDPFGNVLQSASVVYGRRTPDATLPTDKDRQKQTTQQITFTLNLFTTPIDLPAAYRLPILCEAQTWELNTTAPAAGSFFTSDNISALFAAAAIKLYEQDTALNEKRKIEHARTLFRKNDLTGPMPFGTQDTQGLPYENYLLAFTPTLAQNIFGGKFDDSAWRNKGKYTSVEADGNYWIRSGRSYFHPDLSATPDAQTIPAPTMADVNFAKGNFYQPVAFEDNFGNLTKIFYDPHKFFPQRLVDAADNEFNVAAFNYRVLLPYLLSDSNDNRTGVRFDEMGLVIRSFVMGKEGELKGDPIDTSTPELSPGDQPTTIMEYDFRYFDTAGKLPDRVKLSAREQHYYLDPPPVPAPSGMMGKIRGLFAGPAGKTSVIKADAVWQDSYFYSDGSGHEVLKKVQGEPGMAPQRDGQGNLVFDAFGRLQQADTSPNLRWIGNGRTIYNNKGKPVKQYEPYFDSTPEYNTENELAELGFTNILYYDALGRLIRTGYPDGSFSKTLYDAWMLETYDRNDTVLDSAWYTARTGGALGEAAQEAAQKAAVHYDTPTTSYLDSLGRSFLSVSDNKEQRSNETVQENSYFTRIELDIEGNARSMSDARGNTPMVWKYDMLGNLCYQHSMDSGDRWMLADTMGKPLRLWDSRGQIFNYEYDALHRPLNLKVNTGAGDIIFERFQYGEGVASDKLNNLRAQVYNRYDTAGLLTNTVFDFKGNRLISTRTLLTDYINAPDWASGPALNTTESFTDQHAYDAMNRLTQNTTADGSVFLPLYNEASLLDSIDVRIRGAATATHFVTNIDYNAKGLREQIYYGNNTTSQYVYEPDTWRLSRLLTTGNNGTSILQDLNFTYDPMGNITRQFDNAQKTIFYGGQQVEAQSDYIYDAVYRLIEAGGREHSGQIGIVAGDNWNDDWSRLSVQPNSPVQLRNYTQKYFYDGVGNILKMQHVAGGAANWTRSYTYNPGNNQLTKTSVGSQNYSYAYNEHGSIMTMPQLQGIDWDFREEMRHAALGGGGDAYYVYDSSGQRVRKVIVQQGNKITERIYLGGVEIYRERTGNTITLERGTLHVIDDRRRIALIDTRTKGNDGSPAQLIRYQYNNHLGSSCLELDDAAKIISYEEYHPYGTTAYQATDASRQVPAKRYRYTGMERDEETGLNYHTARYYCPWLGRWASADPKGIGGGLNLYEYANDNPIMATDKGGQAPDGAEPEDAKKPEEKKDDDDKKKKDEKKDDDDDDDAPPQPPIYNPGPTQTSGLPEDVAVGTPNTEINLFGQALSPTDPKIGWQLQGYAQGHVRWRTGVHSEQGLMFSLGGIAPTGGKSVVEAHPESSYVIGSLLYTLHVGDTVDSNDKSFHLAQGNWFNIGFLYGNPGKGYNWNPSATYIRTLTLMWGQKVSLDLNVGATAQLWGQVYGQNVYAFINPYLAANVTFQLKGHNSINVEGQVGPNLGLAGPIDRKADDPAVPASLRFTVGAGWQKQVGEKKDYSVGVEVLYGREQLTNVKNGAPSAPNTITLAATVSAF